jgi:mono/diheme cytochrome c family protein
MPPAEPMPQNFVRPSLWLVLSLGLVACKENRELPTWSPADHDNQTKPAQGQVDTKAVRPGMPDLEKQGVNDVVLATWKQTCMSCHGAIGRGDGPAGAALRPPNFTDPTWQKVAIDSEMQHTITHGRGRMPAFAHLPEETVSGLVRLIRLMGARNAPEKTGAPAAETSAEPKTK